jgi:hypothetical protein
VCERVGLADDLNHAGELAISSRISSLAARVPSWPAPRRFKRFRMFQMFEKLNHARLNVALAPALAFNSLLVHCRPRGVGGGLIGRRNCLSGR